MVKSIQYFNDKSVPVFERLEDELLRDPSDIASYIMKLTEELHKTGIRMIEETLCFLIKCLMKAKLERCHGLLTGMKQSNSSHHLEV